MDEQRLIKVALAFVLLALAGVIVHSNLRQRDDSRVPLNEFAQSPAQRPPGPVTGPDPTLSPTDIIRAQLEAIRHNDDTNNGLRLAYSFSSPRNRLTTGPVERFIQIIHSPPYQPMFTYEHAEYGPLLVRQTEAQQQVALFDADGNRSDFVYILSMQLQEPVMRCWMVEGVVRIPPDDARTGPPTGEDTPDSPAEPGPPAGPAAPETPQPRVQI